MFKSMNPVINLTLIAILVVAGIFSASAQATQDEEAGFRQATYLNKKIVTPGSPQAADLGKYGDVQVNLYTGAANIQVPIYTIKGKDLNFPIGLSYDGSGNKVEALPTTVGLGWTFQAGGVITRSAQGNPDLYFNYYSKAADLEFLKSGSNDQIQKNDKMYKVSRGEIESQPDHYYFNFNGHSGKFFIKPEAYDSLPGSILMKDSKDLIITPSFDGNGDITSFLVVDEMGTTYSFNTFERTNLQLNDNPELYGNQVPYTLSYNFNSSWYLTSIVSANGIESIDLEYELVTTQFTVPQNTNYYASMTYGDGTYVCISAQPCGSSTFTSLNAGVAPSQTTILYRQFLKKVTYKLNATRVEEVELVLSTNTTTYGYNSKKLDVVRIKKGPLNTPLIDFNFTQSNSTNRLTLSQIQEKEYTASGTGGLAKNPYVFSYDPTTLPDPTSNSVDHWGYYNGATNTSLIPPVIPCGNVTTYPGGNADRNPNTSYMKAGILTRITYPTGGYTTLNFAPHVVEGSVCQSVTGPDRYAGGLRIEEIKNYHASGQVAYTRTFNYNKEGSSASSGKLLTEPLYFYVGIRENYPLAYYNPNNPGACTVAAADYTCSQITLYASSRSVLGSVQGSHVGYSRVEEVYVGKTVYFYENQPLTLTHLEDSDNGTLLKKEQYNSGGQILVRNEYTYSYQAPYNDARRLASFTAFRVEPMTIQDNRILLYQFGSNPNTANYSWNTVTDPITGYFTYASFKSKFLVQAYSINQSWNHLRKDTETRWFYNVVPAATVSTVTDYENTDIKVSQPTDVLVTNSDGKQHKTVTRFANQAGETDMVTRNMVAIPLKVERRENNVALYRTRLDYSTYTGLGGFNQILPYQYFEWFPGATDTLRETIRSYDTYGNIIEAERNYDQPMAYIWMHNKSLLTAKVINALVTEVAYTGFEEEGQAAALNGSWTLTGTGGGWNQTASNVKIGRAAFNLSEVRNLDRVISVTGKYVVSFWAINGSIRVQTINGGTTTHFTSPSSGSYQYFEYTLDLTAGHTLRLVGAIGAWSVFVDEVRLMPADAQMATFSYDEHRRLLRGIADENSNPAHFTYDGLLRLETNRDPDGYIRQRYQYLFSGSGAPENRVVQQTVYSGTFTDPTLIDNNLTVAPPANIRRQIGYVDGLGRPLQNSIVAQSATNKDIVSLHQYDTYGREVRQNIPYTATTNNGAYRSSAQTELNSFGTTYGAGIYPYAEKSLETSPLNRVLEQSAPGASWSLGSTRTLRYLYRTNTSGSGNGFDNVRDFNSNIFFAAGALHVIEEQDENGVKRITFTDKLGRVILVRQQMNTTVANPPTDDDFANTYTLYDGLGRVTTVIPPAPSKDMKVNSNWDPNSATYNNRLYKYVYDSHGRLSSKIIPSGGTTSYAYDRLDRLVLSTDANGRKTYTRYDILSRPVITGYYRGSNTPSHSNPLYETSTSSGTYGYTTTTFPTDAANADVYSVNYYDHYDLNRNNTFENTAAYKEIFVASPEAGYATSNWNFVRGKLVATRTAILQKALAVPSTYTLAQTYYDNRYRPVFTRMQHHVAGFDSVYTAYDFVDRKVKVRRGHSARPNSTAHSYLLREEYVYDHAGRMRFTVHQINNQKKEIIAEQRYDEMERLLEKNLHASNYTGASLPTPSSTYSYLQSIDYNYNIRSWLTGINDINNCSIQAGDNLADAFSMRMTYQTADYTETPQYNGNIASLSWRAPLGTCRDIQGYNFTYDAANRLKAAPFWERTSGAPTMTDKYSESNILYNLNGNISQYHRRGLTTGTTYGQIDLLVYYYDATNPDRLSRVTDLAPTTNRPYGFKPKGTTFYYGYDNAGNMTSDGHKDLTVAYNALNLPDVFTFANVTPNNKIEITYNAAGEKLEKQVYTGATLSLHKRYVMGIEYTGTTLEAIYHTEGRIVPIGGGVFRYEYTLKDHLGNSRVSFAANGTAIQLLQENHYYPFGMEMKGAWIAQVGTKNGYTYNGKELNEDWGLNWSDYGARWYDASIGRWNAVDFLAESYQSVSPYTYVANNPVAFIDPDGMRVSSIFWGNEQDEEENKKKNQSTTTDILRFITGALHNSETTFDHLNVNTSESTSVGLEIPLTGLSEESFKFYSAGNNWREAVVTNLKLEVTNLNLKSGKKAYSYSKFSITVGVPKKVKMYDEDGFTIYDEKGKEKKRYISTNEAALASRVAANAAALTIGLRIAGDLYHYFYGPARNTVIPRKFAEEMRHQMWKDYGAFDVDAIPGAKVQSGNQSKVAKPTKAIYHSFWDLENEK